MYNFVYINLLTNYDGLIILVNSKGEIIYYSTGYKIGIGEELVKLMENKNCCGMK